MWNNITNQNELTAFMEQMYFFHDSCIKELRYLSGAYVNADLSMYPINDCRILRILIQRQYKDDPMIEMEFNGLRSLKLDPSDDGYTCEILEAVMFFENGLIHWCDSVDKETPASFFVCADSLRWRSIQGNLGAKEFYKNSENKL